MKKGQKLQLSSKWWKDNKGSTVPDSGLEGALKTYEAMLKQMEAKPSALAFEAAADALGKVVKAIKTVISKCKSGVHDETKAALEADEVLIAANRELEKKSRAYHDQLMEFQDLALAFHNHSQELNVGATMLEKSYAKFLAPEIIRTKALMSTKDVMQKIMLPVKNLRAHVDDKKATYNDIYRLLNKLHDGDLGKGGDLLRQGEKFWEHTKKVLRKVEDDLKKDLQYALAAKPN